jgi:hypothetical protein
MAAGGPVDPTQPVPPVEPEPSMPNPERRGSPMSDPTDPFGDDGVPGAYDPTVAVPPIAEGGDGGGPVDGDATDGEEGDDRRKWLWGALAALGVILLGVLIALLVSGGGDGNKKAPTTTTTHATTTTSTSTTTTTTTTTPPTTQPGAPVITTFSSNPASTVSCPNTSDTVQVTLSWTTTNASGVSITIDGGATQSFAASGSAALPFNCGGNAHSYALTAHGANNQNTSKTITLQRTSPPPPTTVAPATTTTTHA